MNVLRSPARRNRERAGRRAQPGPHNGVQRAMRLLVLLLLLLALPPAVRGQASPSRTATQALFVEALTRAFLDDHEGAVSRFREVLEAEPGQPTVLAALAESYAALGQTALAQETADEAVRRAPEQPHLALAAARIAADAGDVTGAEARYASLLQRHADLPAALEALAALHERQGAFAESAALLERLPPDPETLLRLLGHYERLGDDAGFLRAFERRATLRPPGTALQYRLGAHHQRHGRPEVARAVFEAVLAQDSGHREARAALAALGGAAPDAPASPGLAAYAAGDYAEAARLLLAALDLDPRDADGWAQAAMALLEAGQPQQATQVIEDGQLIFFDHPALLVAATYAALLQDDETGAAARIAQARAALDALPEAPPVYRDALRLAEAYVSRAAAPLAAASLAAVRALALAPAPGGALETHLGSL